MSEDTTVTTSPESASIAAAPLVAPAIRRLPMRLKDIELSGEFVGWRITARMNTPLGALTDMASGNIERALHGLGLVIKGWNFVDEDGKPWPPPDKETIGLITQDLLVSVLEAYGKALTDLPKT